MNISRDELKKNYESQSTTELIERYIEGDLTDLARSVLRECLVARGEQPQILDEQKAKRSIYIKEEVKKGKHSVINLRRGSSILAILVGFPLYLYLLYHGWNVGFAIMVTILPLWVVFRIVEHIMTKRRISSLSDVELTNIVDAKVGEVGYEIQKIATDELKKRSFL